MASRSSSKAHRKVDPGSKIAFSCSNIAIETDDDGNIENNLSKLTDIDASNPRDERYASEKNTSNLDDLDDESIFAYSIPTWHSTMTKDKQYLVPSSSVHPYDLHEKSYFSLDGVEVESTISMSWHHEDGSSILGSSILGSFSRRENNDNKVHPNTVGIEASNNGDTQNTDPRRCFCMPSYLRDAPAWIRSVACTSLFLFIASFLLVLGTISVNMVRGKAAAISPARNNNIPDQSFPTLVPSFPPFSKGYSGVQFISKTARPSKKPTSPSFIPSVFRNQRKTMSPYLSRRPTLLFSFTRRITLKPISSSSFSPSSFWILSQQYSNITNMSSLLKSLPSSESTVMALFHLGNWNDLVTCSSDVYLRVSRKYEGSPVPVIFIPGQNETNSCPNPDLAMSYWRQYLLNYSLNTSPPNFILDRDTSRIENFSVVHLGVLYIGVNVVGGNITNQTSWTLRLTQDLSWIDISVGRFKNDVRMIVIFGNSGPSISDTNNDAFFSGLKKLVNTYNSEIVDSQSGSVRTLPFIYIHDSSSSTWGVTQKFMGVNRFLRVSLQGNKWPPLRVIMNPLNYTVRFD